MVLIKSNNPAHRTILLLVLFAVFVGIRIIIGGNDAAQSSAAGLVFAACLITTSLVNGVRFKINRRAILTGIVGGLALCIPAVILRVFHGGAQPGVDGYIGWALIIVIVASSEEMFLRGALFDSSQKWLGENWAIVIPAIVFALMHVPFYGWRVLPLDLAAGLWLGALRITGKYWTAPAVAHVLSDLIAWWLR